MEESDMAFSPQVKTVISPLLFTHVCPLINQREGGGGDHAPSLGHHFNCWATVQRTPSHEPRRLSFFPEAREVTYSSVTRDLQEVMTELVCSTLYGDKHQKNNTVSPLTEVLDPAGVSDEAFEG